MQIDAVDHDIRGLEALTEGRSRMHLDDFIRRDGVEHFHVRREMRMFQNFSFNAQLAKHRKHIGAKLNSITDHAQFRCLFDDADLMALARETQSRCHTTKASAHNIDRKLAHFSCPYFTTSEMRVAKRAIVLE